MANKILLIGAGGHCKSVLDSLLLLKNYSEIGIVDFPEKIGETLLEIPIIACDDDLPTLLRKGFSHAFVTVGSAKNCNDRKRIIASVEKIGFEMPNIVDPSAVVSNFAKMGKGIFVGKNVVVNAGAVVEDGVILNSGCIIEHDCFICKGAHIAPGAVLGGGVYVGEYAFIGTGVLVKPTIKIGDNTVIGMGSVVLNDIKKNVIAYGNPCKEARKI